MEGLSKEYSMDQLATAPVGKQQIIDLNAGAILRKENKRSTKVCYMNPSLLLTLILIIKCLLLTGWLYREYEIFDFGCQMLRMGDYIYQDRQKRTPELDEFLQKQSQPLTKHHPVLGSSQHRALTTMVTMTNLQELPSLNSSAPIRMKTIRQRVEEVNRVPQGDSSEEPTIYISPIQSRNAPPIHDDLMSTVASAKSKKKKKGKGRKKKNKTTPAPTPEPTTKRKKGLGRKKQRLLEQMTNRVVTEQTKSPRHLMNSVGGPEPTQRPRKFLEGGVEHQDRKDVNKGHIRNYPMNKATKRPKNGIKLSEETKLMWQMNEMNYTTHAMQVKTTEMTRQDTAISQFIDALPQPRKKQQEVTHDPRKEFYASKATTWSKTRETTTMAPPVVALRPENKIPREGERFPTTYQPVAIYYETVIEEGKRPLDSTLAQLARKEGYAPRDYEEEESREYYIPEPAKKVKHGFDRSRDAAIDAGITDLTYRATAAPTKESELDDEEQNARFRDELRSFTSNALCLVRTLFDTWCGFQLLTVLACLPGMCIGARNFFIPHLISDIFLLGGGFLFSVTLLGLSILLYVTVEGMSTAEFLQWLMFVFIIEAMLIVYTIAVYIFYQCTERIIAARKNSKPAAEVV